MSVDTDGMRHWCDSVEQTFKPRKDIPRGEAPKRVPETFLAGAIEYLRATCDDLDKARKGGTVDDHA